ncbi:OmpH family outer membrane protein [Sphingomonas sp. So64.6b]|nr:OmpH family outer membrane protein [Sphingomonas sp. So64.6b]
MNTYKKFLLASAMIASPLIAASSAQAQVSGIAVADPEGAILGAKSLEAANATIATTYKAQLDQVRTRQQALQTELTALAAPLDTNKDKQVSEQELAAAEAAKNPILQKIKTAQTNGQQEVSRLNAPALRAQAYVIEQITQKYNPALETVVAAKKISLVLSANSAQFAQPAVDITDAIRAEIDRVLPTANITPPANWQPGQQTVQLLQQYQQAVYAQAVRQAQSQGAAPAAPGATTPPAKPQPQGR